MLIFKRCFIICSIVFVFFAIASCSSSSAVNTPKEIHQQQSASVSTIPLILMGPATFTGPTNIQIRVGTPVQFFDPLNVGGVHLVYVDAQKSNPISGAPPELQLPKYVEFKPGVQKYFIFATPGTYAIRCLPHPAMLVMLTVLP